MDSINQENNKSANEHSLSHIYTPLSEAKKEIWRRWNDEKLKKKVEEFLGGDIPEVFRNEPRAVSTRQIATPNKEFYLFHEKAYLSGLKPLAWEFHDDIFITTNKDKSGLGKLCFLKGFNKKNDPVVSYEKVVDLTGPSEKKKFKDIKTVWGQNFIEFHHEILNISFPDIELYDASKWYRSKGKNAKEYYQFLLAIFIRNGILFENFSLNGYEYEKLFVSKVVLPAFENIEKMFSLKPLIVRMTPDDDINNIIWISYQYNLLEYLKTKNKNGI